MKTEDWHWATSLSPLCARVPSMQIVKFGSRLIVSVGLLNSIMFPTIFTLGVAELGPLTGIWTGHPEYGEPSGLRFSTVLQGAIADHIGLQHAFFVPLVYHLHILFYGLSGSKPNSGRYARA
jgi:MFS transporter, FHS family, L-fucose permease